MYLINEFNITWEHHWTVQQQRDQADQAFEAQRLWSMAATEEDIIGNGIVNIQY